MRIVLGVSSPENHVHAMQLIAALRFPRTEIHAVHAIDRLVGPEYFGLPPGSGDLAARIEEMQQQGAEAQIRDAAAALENLGMRAIRREVLGGFPGSSLCHYADTVNANLIAIGWEKHGPVEGLLAGSVARSVLVHARQSVLVAKHHHAQTPLKCVLATDHSKWMDDHIAQLITMHPAGVSEITVLTAFPQRLATALGHLMPEAVRNIRPWMEDKLREKNDALIKRLRDMGPVVCESVVSTERVDHAIATTMAKTGADMLILGAHGHGFYARAMLGSVSYPQAVYGPHSIMVLR